MKAVAGQFEKGDLVKFATEQRNGFNPQTDVATVLTKGVEVSEIKWATGTVQIMTNHALIKAAPGARQKAQEGPLPPPAPRRGRPPKTAGRPAKPRGKRQ